MLLQLSARIIGEPKTSVTDDGECRLQNLSCWDRIPMGSFRRTRDLSDGPSNLAYGDIIRSSPFIGVWPSDRDHDKPSGTPSKKGKCKNTVYPPTDPPSVKAVTPSHSHAKTSRDKMHDGRRIAITIPMDTIRIQKGGRRLGRRWASQPVRCWLFQVCLGFCHLCRRFPPTISLSSSQSPSFTFAFISYLPSPRFLLCFLYNIQEPSLPTLPYALDVLLYHVL
jgi:hypothetical protein